MIAPYLQSCFLPHLKCRIMCIMLSCRAGNNLLFIAQQIENKKVASIKKQPVNNLFIFLTTTIEILLYC